MRKAAFCICENKVADQLRGDREANQRLCIRYLDSTVPLLSKSEISSLYPSSVAAQSGLCRTRSETRMLVFSRRGSNVSFNGFITPVRGEIAGFCASRRSFLLSGSLRRLQFDRDTP